ncbi:hypothetical protein L596_013945 [Steinernema carpocapsae]|uniref:Uncharacterized protein n=1 Tax=Steinernema carpocapsae TaxID=34508 RepID=A0A4U5N9N0_STECR|nr:hypothetical protein L596_013945 [Steinernema carpocapsae]
MGEKLIRFCAQDKFIHFSFSKLRSNQQPISVAGIVEIYRNWQNRKGDPYLGQHFYFSQFQHFSTSKATHSLLPHHTSLQTTTAHFQSTTSTTAFHFQQHHNIRPAGETPLVSPFKVNFFGFSCGSPRSPVGHSELKLRLHPSSSPPTTHFTKTYPQAPPPNENLPA